MDAKDEAMIDLMETSEKVVEELDAYLVRNYCMVVSDMSRLLKASLDKAYTVYTAKKAS